jgi:ferredoxin like protein
MSTNVEDKLSVNKFDIDRDVHITLDESICSATCKTHDCVFACPAECYKQKEGHVTFSFEGCLECGSCRIACPHGAITWTLPRAGFGICYEYG